MSTLLEQASLVMIPSGYKEDIVYSVIPESGAGDLSFTRASNGTRVNSAGLVEVVPWNIIQNSEQFNAGTWGLAFLSILTDSAVAPNGTTTADLLYPSSNQAYCYASTTSFSVIAGQTYTQSVYFKRSGFRWGIVDNMAGSPGAWFDLLNGVVGNVTSGCTASIENVGNGWYRCSVSSVAQSSTNYADFRMSDTNGGSAVTANGSDGLLAWGFQLNLGSTAKPYFPTTDRLNVPRLTYQNGGGGCPSLLLEKQSTNAFSYSEQLDNGFWTPLQLTVTANNTTSPDGTQNADKFTEDAVSGVHLFYNTSSVTSASTSTASIFYKKGTRRYFSIKLQIGSNSYTQVFDADGLTTGSNSSNGLTSVSTSIVSMGNGWVRASVTGTDPSASTACYMICSLSNSATPTFDSGNFNPSYPGNSSEYGYFWGAQIEASSYPTSYIPTTSSSATRVADACFKTGISSLIGQTSGTILWDLQVDQLLSNENILNIDNGSFGNTIYFIKTSSGGITTEVYASSSLQCSFSYSLPSAGRYKIALAYANNDFALYINGVSRGTDSSGSVPSTSRLQMGNGALGASDGKVNELVLFPTRLTNAELASLTTI